MNTEIILISKKNKLFKYKNKSFNSEKKKKSILDILKFKIFAKIIILIILLYNIYLLIKKNLLLKRKKFNKNIVYSNIEKNDNKTNNKSNNKTKVCLCAIGKKENLYIKEFINHYEKLGFDHIFLYDNNDENDERFEDIIQDEINKGFVSIINYRSYRGKNNNPQLTSYYDCYEKQNKTYNWIAFFDIDEFLEIKPNNITIQDFLDNERYNQCQHIKINWIVYSDNDLLHYENKPIQERFTSKSDFYLENRHVKSIVRGNLSVNYWKVAETIHSTSLDLPACTSSGKLIKSRLFKITPDYGNAFLKHYTTKTIEEYLEKLKKGYATHNFEKTNSHYHKRFQYFFKVNRKTKEKVDIFNKKLNVSFEQHKI